MTGYAGPAESGLETGSVDFSLAANGTIVTDWTAVDLTSLGNAASIGLSFESSDSGAFGVNTPTYVALDDLTVVPEPAVGIFLLIGGAGMLARRRYRSKRISHAKANVHN